ncbi:PREDICTED: CASP-like protein 5C1 [Ipomoea nil]|uniref:CASP-like protein 5C1 n=1 Tax=Ipomoea nil TaxID=35883 RepID=UPI000901785D|nr:PREDICTED: CASP-like protein 5C1 [Ipomoea nil]
MENLPAGAMRTGASFLLRVSQVVCSVAAVLFMCAAAGLLVIVMGALIPWSVTMAVVDAFLVFIRALAPRPRVILMVVIIDWILAMLSLAASCAAASTADFLYPRHDSSNDTTSWSPHCISAVVTLLCFASMSEVLRRDSVGIFRKKKKKL